MYGVFNQTLYNGTLCNGIGGRLLVGINKPDRRLFDYALEVTNSQATDTLMIGDNYDADIMGAMQAGWGQIYFDRNHRGITAQEPQHTVHNLREVMEIL